MERDYQRWCIRWNEAFEKAGFKNALEVKVQPDDANGTQVILDIMF